MGEFGASLLRQRGPYDGGPLTLFDQIAMARGQLPGSQMGSRPAIPMADAVVQARPPVSARPSNMGIPENPQHPYEAARQPVEEPLVPIPGAGIPPELQPGAAPTQSIENEAYGAVQAPTKKGFMGTLGQILLGLVEGGAAQAINRGTGNYAEQMHDARLQRKMAQIRQSRADQMAMEQFAMQQKAGALGIKGKEAELAQEALMNPLQVKKAEGELEQQTATRKYTEQQTATQKALIPLKLAEARAKAAGSGGRIQIRTNRDADGNETDVLVNLDTKEVTPIEGIRRAGKPEAPGKAETVEVDTPEAGEKAYREVFSEDDETELSTAQAEIKKHEARLADINKYHKERKAGEGPDVRQELINTDAERKQIVEDMKARRDEVKELRRLKAEGLKAKRDSSTRKQSVTPGKPATPGAKAGPSKAQLSSAIQAVNAQAAAMEPEAAAAYKKKYRDAWSAAGATADDLKGL